MILLQYWSALIDSILTQCGQYRFNTDSVLTNIDSILTQYWSTSIQYFFSTDQYWFNLEFVDNPTFPAVHSIYSLILELGENALSTGRVVAVIYFHSRQRSSENERELVSPFGNSTITYGLRNLRSTQPVFAHFLLSGPVYAEQIRPNLSSWKTRLGRTDGAKGRRKPISVGNGGDFRGWFRWRKRRRARCSLGVEYHSLDQAAYELLRTRASLGWVPRNGHISLGFYLLDQNSPRNSAFSRSDAYTIIYGVSLTKR